MAKQKPKGVEGKSGFTVIPKDLIAYVAKGDKDTATILTSYAQGEITDENINETINFLNGLKKDLDVLNQKDDKQKDASQQVETNVNKQETEEPVKPTKAEIKAQKKEDDRFERIRAQMILDAFGMTSEEYVEYQNKYEVALADLAKNQTSEFDDLKRAGNIADGARRVVKGDDKAISSKIIDTTLSVNSALAGPIAALGGTIAGVSAALPVIGAAISVASLILLGVKHHKTKKQDASDYEAKNKEYEEKLVKFIQKVQKFEAKLNSRKGEILKASKQFKSKEEYQAYITSMANEIMSEVRTEFSAGVSLDDVKSDLNLDGEMQFDEANKDEQPQENPEENEIQEKKAGSEAATVKTEEEKRQIKNNEEIVQLGD